ncbi:hypothetical protein KI688_001058 [Linnemannia hyalina]|uniref:Uncharacterized protein n=1 Tax=Linnemannia hyalina TaxID=64524 RepID=A0A9P7Y5P2_9FUNG|nr:hypothetical protein KI688_001058 [Linnemannia hyalina]
MTYRYTTLQPFNAPVRFHSIHCKCYVCAHLAVDHAKAFSNIGLGRLSVSSYTNKIDRAVLSETDKASLVWCDSAGKTKGSVGWRPLNQKTPWLLKNVTWKELKYSAVHYGLENP